MKKFFIGLLLGALLCCPGCGRAGSGEGGGLKGIVQIENVDTAFGTVIVQKLYTTEKETRAAEEITELLKKLEREELSKRLDTSAIWRLNEAAGGEEGSFLSAELEEILGDCMEMWQKSEGAFDVTLGAVAALWDIDGWAAGEREGTFLPPGEEELAEALEKCGSSGLKIEDSRLYMPEGMQLDLGAVGKGIAMDRLSAYLEEKDEITGAIISLGGSVLTYGGKPDGQRWNVGIADPRDSASCIGTLALEGNWFVSTSGDYERWAEAEGVRYHHILDPATGYPADSGVAGVTILSGDGFLSDALSTACFVLGPEKGMALAVSCGAEALFVAPDGSVTMTEGMREYFTL